MAWKSQCKGSWDEWERSDWGSSAWESAKWTQDGDTNCKGFPTGHGTTSEKRQEKRKAKQWEAMQQKAAMHSPDTEESLAEQLKALEKATETCRERLEKIRAKKQNPSSPSSCSRSSAPQKTSRARSRNKAPLGKVDEEASYSPRSRSQSRSQSIGKNGPTLHHPTEDAKAALEKAREELEKKIGKPVELVQAPANDEEGLGKTQEPKEEEEGLEKPKQEEGLEKPKQEEGLEKPKEVESLEKSTAMEGLEKPKEVESLEKPTEMEGLEKPKGEVVDGLEKPEAKAKLVPRKCVVMVDWHMT